MINVSQRDALKAKVLPPGWVFAIVENYFTKSAASDGSTNHCYEITVIDGIYARVPLQEYLINEKAPGMGKNFFIACGQPKEEWDRAEKGEAIAIDENAPVGKIIKVNVTPEKFGNRVLNKCGDFLPLTAQEKERLEPIAQAYMGTR